MEPFFRIAAVNVKYLIEKLINIKVLKLKKKDSSRGDFFKQFCEGVIGPIIFEILGAN